MPCSFRSETWDTVRSCGIDRPAGRGHHTLGAVERARLKLETEKAVSVDGTGHAKIAHRLAGEAEATVIGFIADEHDGAIADRLRLTDRLIHQSRADAAPA